MKSIGEKRLVRKLKARDPRAFETLVKQYQRSVFNLVYRMIGAKEEAEDLAQEVFVNVFKKIDTFRGDSSLSTWILRIASNACKNRQKYLGRRYYDRPARVLKDEQVSTNPTSPRTAGTIARPDELVEGYQTERLLQEAIGSLDDEQRLVLVLRDIQGMTYDEISEITGLALGTVKSRLHRARMSLKEKLAPHLR
ncbi:MAG: sigma-70 family RNA polymerase sigma factor [Deltaproteobacteria bacterium]|nr:sigma-70 family RNA polymerase sigma factor [Deltaproteobacteria bacterium]